MASAKADYLKKYQTDSKKEKKRKKVKKRANLAIHDDDVDWRSLIPKDQPETEEEDEPDEAPQVAEYKDDSVTKIIKWQPLQSSDPVVEDTDLSPPRRTKKNRMDSPDLSPLRERKYKVDDDLSPPRRKKHTSNDTTRPGKSRGRQNSPQLIERGITVPSKRKLDSLDASPPRRKRHDSPDASPPRRKRHDSPDASPPRRNRRAPDSSPLRQSKKPAADDLSLPRAKRSRDLSPPRKKSGDKMSSGAKAGLQDAQALKEENAKVRQRQEDSIKEMDPSLSGRHAETVYRDKQGRKLDPRLEKLKQKEKERAMEEENEKFMTWGKGTAQVKSKEEKLQEDLYEMSKPLARYADDEDLEKMLKARDRAGDPMLAFIKKKSNRSKTKSNKKPRKERPTYKKAFPPNRYGIRPGYRWDGVNRSNGFEKTLFSRESNSVAVAEEAYKWSVEDM